VAKNQSDAESWLKLAQAYQTANQPDQAIAAYQRYIALRPNDALEMTSLVGLLEQRGDQLNTIGRAYATRAQDAQGQTGALATGRLKLAPGLTQKVADTLAAPLQQRAQELSSQAQGEFTQAISLRKRLLKLDPTNSTNAFFLGTDGLNARDYPTALSAFQRYLKLVPNAANKAQVKDAIKQQLLQQKKQQELQKWWKDTQKDFSHKIAYANGYSPPKTTSTGATTTG
jgi:cytochrome c-type biogenesis protein CcmH/NrfG